MQDLFDSCEWGDPMATPDHLRIDICVCTFRRPQLVATLQSLARLKLPEHAKVRILVADNDTIPSARERVEVFAGGDIPIDYIHAPERNISVARNACLEHANGDLIAWIDDDETADPLWLVRLYETLRDGGYDAVFGPALAIYPEGTPAHIARGDFHSNRPVFRHGEVQTGHTCNALVEMRKPATRALRFDRARGRTGGEDTDYFHRLWRAGGRLAICDSAAVFEVVEPRRLHRGWLIRRSFNSGHVFGEIARRGVTVASLPWLVLVALLKATYCFAAALLTLMSAMKRLRWVRRGFLHLGVIAGLARIRPREQY